MLRVARLVRRWATQLIAYALAGVLNVEMGKGSGEHNRQPLRVWLCPRCRGAFARTTLCEYLYRVVMTAIAEVDEQSDLCAKFERTAHAAHLRRSLEVLTEIALLIDL